MTKKTKFDHALADLNLTMKQYINVVKFFDRNGLDFGWVPRRGFRFMLWGTGVDDYPVLTNWCDTGAVRDYLDAPQTVFANFDQRLTELRAHAATISESG